METTGGLIFFGILGWLIVFALHVAILRWLLRLNTILFTLQDIHDELKGIGQATKTRTDPVL